MKNLYIKQVSGKGRGVFSNEDIKNGDIVEVAPVFVFPKTFSNSPEKHEYFLGGLLTTQSSEIILPRKIYDYYFGWPSSNQQKQSCIALGYGSLYNSANPSNMKYTPDVANLTLVFTAIIDIPKNTELTINYFGINGSHVSTETKLF